MQSLCCVPPLRVYDILIAAPALRPIKPASVPLNKRQSRPQFLQEGETDSSSSPAMAGKAARVLICVALVLLLLLVEIMAPGGQAHAIDCGGACSYRCSKSSRPNLCGRACNTCCRRCGCVPPGTAGNEDVCPCYAHMTTHNGRHKCP